MIFICHIIVAYWKIYRILGSRIIEVGVEVSCTADLFLFVSLEELLRTFDAF